MVNAERFTCAVLLWFEAPEPVACCCDVDELPELFLPTPLPLIVATPAFDPSFANAPLSAWRDAREEGDGEGQCGNGGEGASGTDACHVNFLQEPKVRLVPRQLADRLGLGHDVARPELPTESPANHPGGPPIPPQA